MTSFLHIQRTKSRRNIAVALSLVLLLVSIGVAFYTYFERWSFIDALYFSVVTLATVGYGDLHPTHDVSQIFTMLYILFGVGLVLFVFSTISNHIMELHDRKKFEDEIMTRLKKIEEMLEK